MYSLLRFDGVEIAKKVFSVLDAQNLVNLLDYIIHDQNFVKNGGMNLTCKVFPLVRDIYTRIPVLPQSLLYETVPKSTWKLDWEDMGLEVLK
ncbi:hypothetical protein M378DRAFT_346524 [Amanita muscaria Koide BX008]|uniref:Uncharacterized protein n=1 Tax=Amanita muscaria (strain Koide BX008) TaxID=946122 RepID=A0A0C2WMT0_AMAMK|nr:hypothetical protein M378DRAFT_346524 [Amanita muscaria Koide BX008]